MAGQGSPAISGGGGFTPINRSPGNDSMSSGLPVHEDKKRRSDAQVAAVVTYDRPKAILEPLRDVLSSSSSGAGSQRTSGGVLVASGAPGPRGSASSGIQGGSRRLSSAVVPDPGGVAHSARISVPIVVDQSFADFRQPVPLQGNEGRQQAQPAVLSAAVLMDHARKARAADGSGSLSSAVVGTSLSGGRGLPPAVAQHGGGSLPSAVMSCSGGGGLPSAVGTSRGHIPQAFDISGAVVDFDAQFAADLEAEIMHPAPRLRDFITIQAEQQQRMRDLRQQVDNQQDEMSKAVAHAALNDRVKSSLQQTLSKERAEREQAESAANKIQWVEAQRTAERIASVEAKARQ